MELLRDVGVGGHRGYRAVAGRGHDLTQVFVADVARGEDAFDGGLHFIVGIDPAASGLLDDRVLGQEVGYVRLGADKDEAARHREVGYFAGLDVFKYELLDDALAFDRLHDRIPDGDDLRVGKRLLYRQTVGPPFVTAVDDVYFIGKARKVAGLFDRDVAAADDGDRLALKEGRVADRAVADAGAGEFGFAGAAELPEARAGREDDRLGLDLAFVGYDEFAAVSEIYLLHRAVSEFSLEVFGVLAEGLSELGTC